MPEPAKVFEDRLSPSDWRVEWEDEDGGVEVMIFSGPDAHDRAIEYADWRYRHLLNRSGEIARSTRDARQHCGGAFDPHRWCKDCRHARSSPAFFTSRLRLADSFPPWVPARPRLVETDASAA